MGIETKLRSCSIRNTEHFVWNLNNLLNYTLIVSFSLKVEEYLASMNLRRIKRQYECHYSFYH